MTGIAVVVTCYDLGRTLARAVLSAQGQSRKPAEIIVIDDGSRDVLTKQELVRLSARGVRVVRTDNRGVAAARNLGVRLTASPYLVMLDADDLFEPTYLEKAAAILDADSALHFVSCAMRSLADPSYTWTPPPCDIVATLSKGGIHASTMFRREVWYAVGGFDEELPGLEDTDFWVGALARGFRGTVIDEPLLSYGVRPGSRQREAMRREVYVRTMESLYRKHGPALDPRTPDLLQAKEEFLLEQRRHQDGLLVRKAEMERVRAALEEEIGSVTRDLAGFGLARVEASDLRRLEPVSPVWGMDRGRPVDRHYIESFLRRHQGDIRGAVLEVKDPGYTRTFGGDRVERADVLDIDAGNDRANVVADLSNASGIADGAYDCFILTQTLGVIYDVREAIGHALRILRPGGMLLATLPASGRISYEDGGLDGGDYWRFTEAAVRALFAEHLPPEAFDVTPFGNVWARAAFLYGLSAEELTPAELDASDPFFALCYGVRAVKPAAGVARAPIAPRRRAEQGAGLILAYHRIADPDIDPHGLCVSPADFRAQMACLTGEYQPMALSDLCEAAASGFIPDRAVSVTFDDGYADWLTDASSCLSMYGIPATFFVTADRLEEEHEHWWDTLAFLLLDERVPTPPALELSLPSGKVIAATSVAAERAAAHRLLHARLVPLPHEERMDALARIERWCGRSLPARRCRALLGSEIAALAARHGHAIGAHSCRHLHLPSQPRAAKEREIAGSREALERLLDRPVALFSYPYGDFDGETVDAVRASGFTAAVTTMPGRVVPGCERLLLPRIEVGPGSVEGFHDSLRVAFAGRTP